nr:hypothetical protein [Tanacetum cinerariifolium]
MNGYVAYELDKPGNKGLKKSLKVAAKVVVAVVAKVEAKEAVVVEKVVVTQLKVAVVAVARAGEDQFHEGARRGTVSQEQLYVIRDAVHD